MPVILAESPSSGGLYLVDQRPESLGLANRQLGKDLPIDLDAGPGEAGDEHRVGEAELADGSVHALDPKRAEGALLQLSADIFILQGALDRLLGGANRVLATAVIALRLLQNLLVLGMG